MPRYALASFIVLVGALHTGAAFAAGSEKEAVELYKKGVELGNQGKLDEAIVAFQQAVKKAPEQDVFHLKLGLAYQMADRWPEALAEYDAAVKTAKKKKPDTHFYLGSLYDKMGLRQPAVDAFKQALAVDPKFAKAHYELGKIYIEMKLLSDAVRELREAITLQPEYPAAQVALGRALVEQESLDEAKTALEGVLAKQANNADALYWLGDIARRQKNPDQAKEFYQKACKLGHSRACRDAKGRYLNPR